MKKHYSKRRWKRLLAYKSGHFFFHEYSHVDSKGDVFPWIELLYIRSHLHDLWYYKYIIVGEAEEGDIYTNLSGNKGLLYVQKYKLRF